MELLSHLIQRSTFSKMGGSHFKHYYRLNRDKIVIFINTKSKDNNFYFISFSELEEIINLYKKDKEKYNGPDWYQVWQDLIEIYPNTKIRIQDIRFIGPKVLKKEKDYLSGKSF